MNEHSVSWLFKTLKSLQTDINCINANMRFMRINMDALKQEIDKLKEDCKCKCSCAKKEPEYVDFRTAILNLMEENWEYAREKDWGDQYFIRIYNGVTLCIFGQDGHKYCTDKHVDFDEILSGQWCEWQPPRENE